MRASPSLRRLSRRRLWCVSGGTKDFEFRFAYDYRITLPIYAHITDGMHDAATAALEEAFSRAGC